MSSTGLSLPSMPSRNSVAETSVTNLLRESGSGACLDLQVIDTVRSGRDREDAVMHHLLCGGLYKPRRRVRAGRVRATGAGWSGKAMSRGSRGSGCQLEESCRCQADSVGFIRSAIRNLDFFFPLFFEKGLT